MFSRIINIAAIIAIAKERYIGKRTFSLYVITKRIEANIHAVQKTYIHKFVSAILNVGENPI